MEEFICRVIKLKSDFEEIHFTDREEWPFRFYTKWMRHEVHILNSWLHYGGNNWPKCFSFISKFLSANKHPKVRFVNHSYPTLSTIMDPSSCSE